MLKYIFTIVLTLSNVFALNVGEISMLRGEAKVTRGNNQLNAKIQMLLEDKDAIETGENTKIQLTFKDKTVITLGSQTVFKIEEYLYDNADSKIELNVKRGAFKVITGKIGKLAPKNFLLKTKTSLIGIRGTIFAGEIKEKRGDYITCIKGSIVISSLNNKISRTINNGEIIFIKGDGSFGDIKKLDQENFTILSHLEKSKTQKSTVTKNKNEVATQTIQSVLVDEDKTLKDENELNIKNNNQDIDHLIKNRVTANYKGKLNGTSSGKYTTASTTTNLNAKIDANMDMKIDFGGNNPLKVDIYNQKLTLNKASVNGNEIQGDDLKELNNQVNSMGQISSSMEMKQNIDVSNLKITANQEKTANGFTTKADLEGTFKDSSASGVTGTLKESTKGSAGNVGIDRTIDASFDLNKN